MSSYRQYYDFSSENEDSDYDSDTDSCSFPSPSRKIVGNDTSRSQSADSATENPLWKRSILHIDIDCFYVQCEELDRGLRYKTGSSQSEERPLAIGQKHIVVTCNYVARARGVSKLMSKTDAMVICPDLLIVDGSDLRKYRQYSRRVYHAFRRSIHENIAPLILPKLGHLRSVTDSIESLFPCKKNAMDEMMADLSTIVDGLMEMESSSTKGGPKKVQQLLHSLANRKLNHPRSISSEPYIFGEDASSSVAHVVEDQTGANSRILFGDPSHDLSLRRVRSLAHSRKNVHEQDKDSNNHHQQAACRRRLELATELARKVCEDVFQQTQFHCSAGISVSPMLAKLSIMRKPRTTNVLLPWRSPHVLYFMPLRKLNEVGSRTHRALSDEIFSNKPLMSNKETISILDLLEVPREKILASLSRISRCGGNDRTICEEQCDVLLDRCRGLDKTEIEDDEGGAPKTVSVEDSYRRGTMITMKKHVSALNDLCRRLPPLIQDRVAWSKNPACAYPTTIRLTVRMLVEKDVAFSLAIARNQRKTRAFSITRSKQCSMGMSQGKLLLASGNASFDHTEDEVGATRVLRDCVQPLFHELMGICQNLVGTINLTRMNLAVTSFQDSPVGTKHKAQPSLFGVNSEARIDSQKSHGSRAQRQHPRQFSTNPNKVPHSYTTSQSNSAASIDSKSVSTNGEKYSRQRKLSTNAQIQSPKKFARTRIDQFFAKKRDCNG